MDRQVGRIIIPDTRDTVSKARRAPATCLYCAAVPDSREHPLAEALGGRLYANILCVAHNNLVANKCDDPMATQFAPLMFMLGTVRARGVKGASLLGRSDSGERIVVKPNWSVRRRRLESVQKTATGKIKFARGALAKLDELKAGGALDDENGRIIATLEKPPIVNFEIAVAQDAERGVLKTALHFLASFVADVDRYVATELLPYVLGEKSAGGKYVRTLPLEEIYFPESWPPRHEIRSYPLGKETYVTVLLFGLHGFQVRLPVASTEALRHKQPLVESVAPLLERNDHVRRFSWEDRLTPNEWPPLKTNLRFRHAKIEGLAKWRMAKSQCRAAAMRAFQTMISLRIDYLEAYRAELQMEALPADEIARLLFFAQGAILAGQPPWELRLDRYMAS
jgi:hypothetical protein